MSFDTRYPRLSTDRETAEKNNLEWVTPGHPLFEALRRNTLSLAQEPFGKGACYYSLQHDKPARLDFYRARVVDGLGDVIHERLFAVEIPNDGALRLQEPGVVGNFTAVKPPAELPAIASAPEATEWLNEHALDRRDCYWLYVVTSCKSEAILQEPTRNPARFPWHEVKKVDHYYLSVDALTQPMQVRDPPEPYKSPGIDG